MQSQRPALIQEQRQKLSPQMLQSIKLMSLPVQDLAERIQEELEANPALDVVEEKKSVSLDEIPEGDAEVESYFESTSDSGYRGAAPSGDSDSKRMFIEGAVARPETLQDHLIWQLKLQPISSRKREIGEILIHNLTADGFHAEPLEKLFSAEEIDTAREMARMISEFEPVGCCVADYRESLLAQAAMDPGAPPEAAPMLRDHLELLEKAKFAEIARKLKADEGDVREAAAYLRKLHPFPGRQYSSEETVFVVPDLMVKPKDGDFVIILNDEEIPVLGVNPLFADLSAKKGRRPGEKDATDYARRTMRDARFFIQSIHQRNRTLLRVARSVVELQRPFFIKGPKYLEPLTLKTIADEIGVHETTVSRIASKKYVQTEWGIFELRYFFTNPVSGDAGTRFSKQGVKEMIREIIEAETSALSDQGIADLLSQKGVKIARRTVAKYRNELKMNTSFDR